MNDSPQRKGRQWTNANTFARTVHIVEKCCSSNLLLLLLWLVGRRFLLLIPKISLLTKTQNTKKEERVWSQTFLPLNRWVHIAAVAQGRTLRLFVDGILESENTTVGRLFLWRPNVKISLFCEATKTERFVLFLFFFGFLFFLFFGQLFWEDLWRVNGGVGGKIDDVYIFSRALSADEIAPHAAVSLGLFISFQITSNSFLWCTRTTRNNNQEVMLNQFLLVAFLVLLMLVKLLVKKSKQTNNNTPMSVRSLTWVLGHTSNSKSVSQIHKQSKRKMKFCCLFFLVRMGKFANTKLGGRGLAWDCWHHRRWRRRKWRCWCWFVCLLFGLGSWQAARLNVCCYTMTENGKIRTRRTKTRRTKTRRTKTRRTKTRRTKTRRTKTKQSLFLCKQITIKLNQSSNISQIR